MIKFTKKSKQPKYLVWSILASVALILIITFVSPNRYVKELTFKLENTSKQLDFLNRYLPTGYSSAPFWLNGLEGKLRDDSITGKEKNPCSTLKPLVNQIPVSISYIDMTKEIKVNIVSQGLESTEKCSEFILQEIDLYNEEVRKSYLENYDFISSILRKPKGSGSSYAYGLGLKKDIINIFIQEGLILDELIKEFTETLKQKGALYTDEKMDVLLNLLTIVSLLDVKSPENMIEPFVFSKVELQAILKDIKLIVFVDFSSAELKSPNKILIFINMLILFMFILNMMNLLSQRKYRLRLNKLYSKLLK